LGLVDLVFEQSRIIFNIFSINHEKMDNVGGAVKAVTPADTEVNDFGPKKRVFALFVCEDGQDG